MQNAWTNRDLDTRNVVTHEFVLEVMDVQDTAPFFLQAPPVTRLKETATEVRITDTVLSLVLFSLQCVPNLFHSFYVRAALIAAADRNINII